MSGGVVTSGGEVDESIGERHDSIAVDCEQSPRVHGWETGAMPMVQDAREREKEGPVSFLLHVYGESAPFLDPRWG